MQQFNEIIRLVEGTDEECAIVADMLEDLGLDLVAERVRSDEIEYEPFLKHEDWDKERSCDFIAISLKQPLYALSPDQYKVPSFRQLADYLLAVKSVPELIASGIIGTKEERFIAGVTLGRRGLDLVAARCQKRGWRGRKARELTAFLLRNAPAVTEEHAGNNRHPWIRQTSDYVCDNLGDV